MARLLSVPVQLAAALGLTWTLAPPVRVIALAALALTVQTAYLAVLRRRRGVWRRNAEAWADALATATDTTPAPVSIPSGGLGSALAWAWYGSVVPLGLGAAYAIADPLRCAVAIAGVAALSRWFQCAVRAQEAGRSQASLTRAVGCPVRSAGRTPPESSRRSEAAHN